ncbi:inner membrane transporter RhtA [Crossiella equi]|uniref:Inner membrane transporter RhtA n=1 Tax=Crossiella equi TaxID=130796 RepID=A0ABS5AB67_9PSEU|nr:EamA family transporter [Crossiella equi]MBP2473816.1 inner membrane transporter RhtA [Crossiella equi]
MTALTVPAPSTLGTRLSGVGLVLVGMTSVQFSATLAVSLYPVLGPLGVVTLRLVGAAVLMLALFRPRLRGRTRREWLTVLAFGAVMTAMNVCVYLSIQRLPLGAAITLEYLGPLSLAIVLSRRRLDFVWAGCAGLGVLLLSSGLAAASVTGVLFALGGGVCWAGYILLTRRLGQAFTGVEGLALGTAAGAVLVLPVGAVAAGPLLLRPENLLLGLLVGLLASAVPYTMDLLALRRLPAGAFGTLMSLQPAVAALAGFVVLGQVLTATQLLAIGLVVLASAGTAVTTRPGPAG